MRNEIRTAYDAWHAEQGDEVDGSSNTPWHGLLKPLLNNLAGCRVLEIGCGGGGFALWLATLPEEVRPREIVASDFSSVAVRMAEKLGRSYGVGNITYQVGDLMALDWEDACFDVVISCETIEHVADPHAALKELARVLRPNGMLYATCPNYLNLMGLYRLALPLVGRPFSENGQPINHFLLLPQVRQWVRQVGLEIQMTLGVGHYVGFPGRSPFRIASLDSLGRIGAWLAHHTAIVARKPQLTGLNSGVVRPC